MKIVLGELIFKEYNIDTVFLNYELCDGYDVDIAFLVGRGGFTEANIGSVCRIMRCVYFGYHLTQLCTVVSKSS